MPENMFSQTMLVQWTFMLILYTRLYSGVHAVSDACNICNCDSSGSVNCTRRGLTSIPTNIPPNTTVLVLFYNHISSIQSGYFSNLYNLTKLDLSFNQISSIQSQCFSNLYNLKELYLNSNNITVIRKGTFHELFNLRTLVLSNNRISSIQSQYFSNLYNLKELYLNFNQISSIQSQYFSNLYNLKELFLHSNKITVIRKGTFHELFNLRILLLNDNQIKSYEDGAFLFLPNITEINLERNPNLKCGCHLPALVKYTQDNYKITVVVKGQCLADLGGRIPIMTYSQCTNYSLFQRNLTCQTYPGMMSKDSEVTSCPGAEPVCRSTSSMKGVTLEFEKSCSTYRECVDAMRNNIQTCKKWTNGTSCTGCCVGDLCNKKDLIGRNNPFVFYLIFKNSNEYKISDEKMSILIDHELLDLSGTFSVEHCRSTNKQKVFTIFSVVVRNITKDELRRNIYNVLKASKKLPEFHNQQQNLKLIDGMFCNDDSTTSNDATWNWPMTKIGSNATIRCGANVATRYCSSKTVKHLERASNQSMTSVKCSPFTGIWQEPDMSQCNNTEWITRRLKDLISQSIDRGNVDNISKTVLNVSQNSGYFKEQDIDLAVGILERMVPLISNVSANITRGNVLLGISNMINTPEKVLTEAERANRSASRMLDIIETIPEEIPLEEQQVAVSYPNLGIGVAKVNTDTFDGLFYGVSYGTNDTEASILLYNHSYSDQQEDDIQTFSFISIPKNLLKHLKDEERSVLSRIVFVSMRNDKLYNVIQNSSAKGNTRIVSYVLAANVPNISIRNISPPVKITFRLINQNATNLKCVYWDDTPGENPHWSTEGCKISDYEPGEEILCLCDHLTSFALLMDVYQNEAEVRNVKALSIISLTGCGISFVFLVLTIIIHVCFRNLRNLLTSKILVSLCVPLAVANLIFVVGMQPDVEETLAACKAVAILLHYFLLASFMWTCVEGIHAYLCMVFVFRTYQRYFMKGSSTVAWGLPAVIVLITLVINNTNNYTITTGQVCWLSKNYFYATFLAPVGMILLVNLTMSFLIIRRLILRQKNKQFGHKRRKVRVVGIVGLFFLLGLTWVLAFFAVGKAAEVFKYLFAILNTLQGTFIFIFYCICKKDTRDVIMKYFSTRKRATFPTGRGRRRADAINERAETGF